MSIFIHLKEKLKGFPALYFRLWKIYYLPKYLLMKVNSSKIGYRKYIQHQMLSIPLLMKAILLKAFDSLCKVINCVCFIAYKFSTGSNRHDKVNSVLHISIISHKQFMLSRVLRNHGIQSHFLALNADIAKNLNIGFDYSIPYHINPIKRKLLEVYYLWAVLARHDVIHSHFNTFLTSDGYELEFLKRLGKVIVFHFRGCDLRQKSINMGKNPVLNICQECDYPEGSCDMEYQCRRLEIVKEYGDLFFVTTPDMRDFMPEAEHIPFIIPYAIDFDKMEAMEKRPGVFRVVTSSNHHGIDGTKYIRQAIDMLQDEGHAVELIEVSNMPYKEALTVYKSADVYVGKLRMGYYNNANIECMLMGVPCMSYIRTEFLKDIPDCPIIITTPDTVYQNLKRYIDTPEELREIGNRGPGFIKKYHDADKIVKYMISLYDEALGKKWLLANSSSRMLHENSRTGNN